MKHRKLKHNTPTNETISITNPNPSIKDPTDKNSLPEVQLGKMSAASAHRRRLQKFSGRNSYLQKLTASIMNGEEDGEILRPM